MLGAIFASGWTVSDVLDLTWEQVGLVGECIALYRSESIQMVADPVLAALGSKSAKGRVGKASARSARSDLAPADRDAALIAAISGAGFRVS